MSRSNYENERVLEEPTDDDMSTIAAPWGFKRALRNIAIVRAEPDRSIIERLIKEHNEKLENDKLEAEIINLE